MKIKHLLFALVLGLAVTGSAVLPDLATPVHADKLHKCNSGGGNGSEGGPDCDPGGSGDNNNGKD
jgi:hypothetical protein